MVLVELLSRRGSFCAMCLNFFQRGVSVRALFGFVFLRRAYYGLVWAFSTSVFSPVVKRGKHGGRKSPDKPIIRHTSELQSLTNLVCRLLLEKKKKNKQHYINITTIQ